MRESDTLNSAERYVKMQLGGRGSLISDSDSRKRSPKLELGGRESLTSGYNNSREGNVRVRLGKRGALAVQREGLGGVVCKAEGC